MAQFESAYDELQKRGAAAVFIAAQRIEGWFKGKEYVEQRQYPFPILFDETRGVTRRYGVYHRLGVDAYNIAHPAVFVVGPSGRICWIAVSPSQYERPELGDVLAAIEAAR